MKLKDLAIDHDFCCNESNYYSNDASCRWDTFSDFYEEYRNADIDMNLIFRWDIKNKISKDDEETVIENEYFMEVFIMHQRTGIFAPHYISSVVEEDVPLIQEIMNRHFDKIKRIWMPLI